MPPARNPSAKPAATIINATAKTRSVIEGLQARLTELPPAAPPPPQQHQSIEDLERELRAYFERSDPTAGSRSQLLDDLRNRVVDGVVDRILSDWANSSPGALGQEVMDRLIERVLQEFQSKTSA